MSSDGNKPGKEDAPHHAGMVEDLGDSLPSPQSCMPHNIVGMAGGQLSSKRLPVLKAVEGYPMWANDHHQVVHMPAMGKLQIVAMVQTPTVEPP